MRYSVCFPFPLIFCHVTLSNRYCKFFSDPKNPRVQSYAKIVEFPKFHVHHIGLASSKNGNPMFHENRWVPKILCLPYWVCHFEFRKFDVKFVISNLKNLGVLSSTKIVGFPRYYVRHIGSAILNSENSMSNS